MDSNVNHVRIIVTHALTMLHAQLAQKSLYMTERAVSVMDGSFQTQIPLLMKNACAHKVLKRKMESA